MLYLPNLDGTESTSDIIHRDLARPNGFRAKTLIGQRKRAAAFYLLEQLDFIDTAKGNGLISDNDIFVCHDYLGNDLVYYVHQCHLNCGKGARPIYPEFKAMVNYDILVTRTGEITNRSIPLSQFLWNSPCKERGKPETKFRTLAVRGVAA